MNLAAIVATPHSYVPHHDEEEEEEEKEKMKVANPRQILNSK